MIHSSFLFQPGLLSRFTPELDLILRSALWNYSVRLNGSTFGQRLLFISYDHDQLYVNYRVHLHFVLNILLKYFKDNVTFRFTRNQSLQQFIAYAEHCIALMEIVNFFRFLKIGKRPSLIDYTLGLDHISMYGNRRREIGYSHMTRELIWGGFMVRKQFRFNSDRMANYCELCCFRSFSVIHCR